MRGALFFSLFSFETKKGSDRGDGIETVLARQAPQKLAADGTFRYWAVEKIFINERLALIR